MFTMGCQKYKYNQISLNGWLSTMGELSHNNSYKCPLGMGLGGGGGAVRKNFSQNFSE